MREKCWAVIRSCTSPPLLAPRFFKFSTLLGIEPQAYCLIQSREPKSKSDIDNIVKVHLQQHTSFSQRSTFQCCSRGKWILVGTELQSCIWKVPHQNLGDSEISKIFYMSHITHLFELFIFPRLKLTFLLLQL